MSRVNKILKEIKGKSKEEIKVYMNSQSDLTNDNDVLRWYGFNDRATAVGSGALSIIPPSIQKDLDSEEPGEFAFDKAAFKKLCKANDFDAYVVDDDEEDSMTSHGYMINYGYVLDYNSRILTHVVFNQWDDGDCSTVDCDQYSF